MNNRICVYTETSINLYSGSIMMLLWWILIDTWSYMYSFDTFIWTIQIRIGWIILSTKRYLHMNGENKKKVHRVNHNPMTQSLVFIIINIYRNKQIITNRKKKKNSIEKWNANDALTHTKKWPISVWMSQLLVLALYVILVAWLSIVSFDNQWSYCFPITTSDTIISPHPKIHTDQPNKILNNNSNWGLLTMSCANLIVQWKLEKKRKRVWLIL